MTFLNCNLTFPFLLHLRKKRSCLIVEASLHALPIWTPKAGLALSSSAVFHLEWWKGRFYEVALLWSLMDHKYPMAVFHASIDSNVWVCIASSVSHSLPPTDSLHFMAMLPPDCVHRPVWIWLTAFMFFLFFFLFLHFSPKDFTVMWELPLKEAYT